MGVLDSFKVALTRSLSVEGYRFLNALAIVLSLILMVISHSARGEMMGVARVEDVTVPRLSSGSPHAITT